jgi:hypothetical protein
MKTIDVVRHFGGRSNVARALGYSVQAVYLWKEYPPELVQFRLEAITEGALKVTPGTGLRTRPFKG